MAKKRRTKRSEGGVGDLLLLGAIILLICYISIKLQIPFWAALGLCVGAYFLVPTLWSLRVGAAKQRQEGQRNQRIVIDTPEQLGQFMAQHQLQETITTKVKGVTFRNDDGSDRQTILARCYPGAPVEIREYSWHGDPAYKVVSEFGQIGVLSADLAQRISSRYGDNVIFQGQIKAVTGGDSGLYFGCELSIKIYQ